MIIALLQVSKMLSSTTKNIFRITTCYKNGYFKNGALYTEKHIRVLYRSLMFYILKYPISIMTNSLTCNDSRILTPAEATSIRNVIEKPSLRALFDLLLYTGLRLSEVKQLRDNPAIFDHERRTVTIKSGKKLATQISRNVCLSDKGLLAVVEYLKNPAVPNSPTAWQMNLIRWAMRARLQALPGQEESGNPYGITVRTTRKSWESWLLAAYPAKVINIVLSQGHTEATALRHYFNISFTQTEREAIRDEVMGWNC